MLGITARKRDLDLRYLMAPFQHKVFYDSIRKTKLGKKDTDLRDRYGYSFINSLELILINLMLILIDISVKFIIIITNSSNNLKYHAFK